MKSDPHHGYYLSHAHQMRRHTITRPDGTWLMLESDGEVVALTTQVRRAIDALYLGQADMQTLVDAWTAWYGVGGRDFRPFRAKRPRGRVPHSTVEPDED